MTNEIYKTAESEKVTTKLVMLSEEPSKVYEILDKIANIVKRKDLDALMQLSNYELFLVYFCCNNDSMSLIYEGKYNFFDEPITYEELYAVLEESEYYINSWTMKDYSRIRKMIDYKTSNELITATQDLGLSPYIINYDFSQPVISILNFIFFKEQYTEIKNAKKSPSLIKKELQKLYTDILSATLTGIIDRYKSMKKFFFERKEVCQKRIQAINEVITSIENESLTTLINIPDNWHQYLTADLLEALYNLTMKNQYAEHKRVCSVNKQIKEQYEQTKFIKFLYDNNIDPSSLDKDILEKLNNLPYEELITKLNFFIRLSININDILTTYINYILNTDISIIKDFNNYLDKGIIKKSTLLSDISILNNPLIIETNYSILRSIIDVHNIYYEDKLLLLNTLTLKNRLSVLAEYNLSLNNYMFLLSNIDFLNIYDLMLEHNIPTYLFISICKTDNPLNTIKKIIICQSVEIDYEMNGKLIREVKRPNSFMCPNESLDEYLNSVVDTYLPEPIQGSYIYDIKEEPIIKSIDDYYQRKDKYLFGNTEISRPKVLRNLQHVKDQQLDIGKYLLHCIISDSILGEKDIYEITEMISIEKEQKTI